MAAEDEIAGLSPGQPFADAGRAIIRHRFVAMWAQRAGTLAGDDDAVHDMRVGSRRLRAALDVFASAFHGAEFRRLRRLTARLTDELGAVRDHDVLLLGLRRYRKGMPRAERAGIDDLMAALTSERDLARRRLHRFFARLDAECYAERMHALVGKDDADG